MKIITTSEARKRLSAIVDAVRFSNRPVAIGRRDKAEALIIKFPESANSLVDEETNMNAYGGGFEFLKEEPELYTREDITVSYV
ncbi:MAG: type II toxin-antitoxin system Phd/YefM family antitoxin [Patescibacteria group bacterium]